MRKLIASIIIGLGLVVGFSSDINACDDEMCAKEFAIEVRDEHIDMDCCEEEHTACLECEGYFCADLTCWCGEEVTSYMTDIEMMNFSDMIHDIYLEEYCTNYCEDCDSYYYKECMCDACYSDCEECADYDYELFIMDYNDIIMDEYYEVLRGIIDSRNNPKVEVEYWTL